MLFIEKTSNSIRSKIIHEGILLNTLY